MKSFFGNYHGRRRSSLAKCHGIGRPWGGSSCSNPIDNNNSNENVANDCDHNSNNNRDEYGGNAYGHSVAS